MPTSQSCEGNFSVDFAYSQMTLICVKLMKIYGTQVRISVFELTELDEGNYLIQKSSK